MAHTEHCERLALAIERIEEQIAELCELDHNEMPEMGDECDALEWDRDQRVALRAELHKSGDCPGNNPPAPVEVGTTTAGDPVVTDGMNDADPPAVHVAVTLPDGTPAGGWTTDAAGRHTPDGWRDLGYTDAAGFPDPARTNRPALDPDRPHPFRSTWNGT